jgi:hypothetical protein
LKEGKNNLMKLLENKNEETSLSDAMDLMIDNDVEMTRESD